jgi:hypothetical protein
MKLYLETFLFAKMEAKALSMRTSRCVLFLLTCFCVAPLHAHIGSPDTFVQAEAGPYVFLMAAHPPATYPGALELDFRFDPANHLTAVTVSLDNAAPAGIQFFTDGTAAIPLWLTRMTSHQLRINVQGSLGSGEYTLTLPAQSQPATGEISTRYRVLLLYSAASLFAVFAAAIFVGNPKVYYASAQGLPPRVIAVGLIALALFFTVLAFRKPALRATTKINAVLTPEGRLDFTLVNPNETFSDLIPDHNKLLHLFLIREPQHDVFLHLHPQQVESGSFTTPLPAMPPGTYTLFADFYHADGRGETATQTVTFPAQSHTTIADPDDSIAILPPLSRADASVRTAHLADGYTLQLGAPSKLTSRAVNLLKVTLLDPAHQPPGDMQLYLGMPAHAVVLRTDDAVFAHIHPGGTLPMLANSMPMRMSARSNTATIPYGFPSPGRYRLFVQMKHGHFIETGAFDLDVR